jgi:hypothetical protein
MTEEGEIIGGIKSLDFSVSTDEVGVVVLEIYPSAVAFQVDAITVDMVCPNCSHVSTHECGAKP